MARYAIGDIHGCLKTFTILLKEKLKLSKSDSLYLLGDYIDRGPDPKGVLDYIIGLQREGYLIRTIRGNHEEMLLNSGEHHSTYATWMYNGAETTLESFGIKNHDDLGADCVTLIPEKYFRFCKSCSYFLNLEPDYIFVHGGININAKEPFRDTDFMIWTREVRYDHKIMQGKTLVHGHTPISLEKIYYSIKNPDIKVINLDGGCVYSRYRSLGNLVALDLDKMELHTVRNIDS